MSSSTPNMGLTRWDTLADPYDHSQLAANFTVIDGHDHTGPPKGLKLGSGAILAGAINGTHLANNSVTSAHIVDGTIALADLNASLLNGLMPLGAVLPWWRSSGATPVPTGWAICNGDAWSTITNGLGLSVGNIPDLRNRFVLGADVAGTGSGSGTPPAIGGTGGAHTANIQHTHTVNGHTHTIPGHTHTATIGPLTVNGHTHSISSDTIKWMDDVGNPQDLSVRSISCNNGSLTVSSSPAGLEFAFIKNQIHTDGFASEDVASTHSHGGSTGSGGSSTQSGGLTTDATGLTTDSTSPGTGNPSPGLGSVDIRPAHTGLLYIMKVRYV